MTSFVQKKESVPFWINEEEDYALFVLNGTINMYYSKIDTDGNPIGSRAFLFQMLEGELFFPINIYKRDDGVSAGILAIPASDCEINQAELLLSEEMIPFAEEWIEKCCWRLGYSREQIEELTDNLTQSKLEEFNNSLMGLFDKLIDGEIYQAETLNRNRYAGENNYLQTALNNLMSVIPGSKSQKSRLGVNDNHLIDACIAVAQESGMEIKLPRTTLEGKTHEDIVKIVAQASQFRTRDVILSDNWHRQDGGSFLAKLEESGEPVALLQKSPRKYIMYNPATGVREKVTKKIANKIDSRAIMFYRSLPTHSLTPKEIFSFVLKGTRKADWAWVFMMGLCGGILGMLYPEITGRLFDTVIPDGNRNMLIQIGLLMGAMTLTTFAFELTRAFAMHRISGLAERDLQPAVWDRMLGLPVEFFKHYSAGELAERAMSISRIQQVLSGTVTNTIITSIFSIFYIIIMFTKSVKLAWFGIGIALVSLAVSVIFCWFQTKHEAKQIAIDNKISGVMFGWLSGLSKIKMSGSERRTFYNWAKMYKESRIITFKKESIGNLSAVWNSIAMLLSSMIIYAVMFNLKDDVISIGAFIAFNAALGSLIQSITQLSGAVMSANVVIPLYREASPIFQSVPEYDDLKTEAPALSGEIELSRINFSYVKDGPQILHDVSLHIRSGEHVALVGPSGSGKSTLFRVLLAFEQPDSGEIYFDKINISQLNIRSVRQQLGVVLQSGMLLPGSIFENVAGSNPNITTSDAMKAIVQAGMEEDLKQMPMGMHTMISEGSSTLSGGQRQRLLIARALVGNPKILFFDEATSALDNKTQKIVSDSINKLKTTRITIAHRLSTIQDCDRIIVLENGRITEEGTYNELLELKGTFASMVKRQIE